MGSVRNLDTGDVVVDRLELATNPWTRFRGFMMRARPAAGAGLLLEPCSSIHMMWMRFGIDAIWLDRDARVTRVSRGVRPWIGMARGPRGTRSVIEVPAGASGGVEPGHRLEITR